MKSAPGFASRPLSDSELEELNRARLEDTDGRPRHDVLVTQPDAEIRSAWWYPLADRVKPFVPESVRHVVRRQLARDGTVTVQKFRLPGPDVELGPDISLDQRYMGTARFTAHGSDPQLSIRVKPFAPDEVDVVRFNLWCSSPGPVNAQLFWRHGSDAGFSEEKSVRIPLDGKSGAWQEYVLRLRDTTKSELWLGGERIVELRFDPLDVPGPVCLGELVLASFEFKKPPPRLLPFNRIAEKIGSRRRKR